MMKMLPDSFRSTPMSPDHRRFGRRSPATTAALGTGILLLVLFAIAGCSRSSGNDSNAGQEELFRQPHPTFTPTAVAAIADSAGLPQQTAPGDTSQPQSSSSAAGVTYAEDAPSARAIVNAPLVNVRAGPSTNDEIVATVERGAEFDVVGRSDDAEWLRVCCQNEAFVWIANDFVDIDGPIPSLPVGEVGTAGGAGAQSPAAAPARAGLGGGAQNASFELVAQEQFSEANLVRIYLYVYDDTGALAGYTVGISKDGRNIPIEAASFGGQPAFTWPFQDARQRYQNLKIELPDEQPQGVWTLQLLDSQGRPAGPPAEFSLSANDSRQELYVRYERSQ